MTICWKAEKLYLRQRDLFNEMKLNKADGEIVCKTFMAIFFFFFLFTALTTALPRLSD